MQEIKINLALAWVTLLRYFLVFKSLLRAVTLHLPLKYSTFPLLTSMNMKHLSLQSNSKTCDPTLQSSVDVIVSLYKFERYKKVLEHSISSCFNNPKITYHFVLVSGTESEISWITSLTQGSHHKVHVVEDRIGIYRAWNLAIERGSSEFITNLNADDLRLPHSICNQAAALQTESVAGSFGNFILTNDIFSTIESKQGLWLASNLGPFDIETLVTHSQNNMHCAPMWRRSIHSSTGVFDDSLQSSGDTDLWLRAMVSGYKFVQYPPVTAVYFHNPEGLSTSVSSSGHKEWANIRSSYIRKLYGK